MYMEDQVVSTAASTSKFIFPKLVFGTSALGNLFEDIGYEAKKSIIAEIIGTDYTQYGEVVQPCCFDCAGKYGAGLALELLGRILHELGVQPDAVNISNKLGWRRIPLQSSTPTFEPGAWVGLEHDAVQDISYEGIMRCYHEGNCLLGNYKADVVSIHDPDEYLAAASDEIDYHNRMLHVMDGYRALHDLKVAGEVTAVGIGAKEATVIELIVYALPFTLDWVMIACQLTVYDHTVYVQNLVSQLAEKGIQVLNSAVFNSGFLVGGTHYNYQGVSIDQNPGLFSWRDKFYSVTDEFFSKSTQRLNPGIDAVCVGFSLLFSPTVSSVVLNSSSADLCKRNISLVYDPMCAVPDDLWATLKQEKILKLVSPAEHKLQVGGRGEENVS